ncbi:J domain-containing protein [Rubinisphaera sp.]|uniref:J domain-containing protein n=1 Tax=Rubinisphaera sp. TaxID=2024857 RepID=UPI000C0E90C6|nr:J domain-containing protein [Rubinisphaera sp.]MBV10799.1 hypothetical protein [Rubinisphaera sp.]HCS55424.1 hypothetical protein [Planctomycetaceae bacterium]|tara:strand:+ start:588 stop:2234 length:1647 start_codon:yes stop_codon:yes gene_type:complete
MSDDQNSNPDWSLLPSQPQKFFDLEDDFSLRDLKRSYGKLIKKFRPEQSPDEFQKIRMAYERLLQIVHNNLDINDVSHFRSTEPERHSQNNHDDFHSVVHPSERSLPKIDVCANVQDGRPLIEIYQSLLAQNYKTEEDFLSLAVLSDVIDETAEDENFAEWLINGINYLHSAPILMEYLLEYSRTHIPDEKLEEWITLLANRLPPYSFSFISTPAWMQLIRAESEELKGTVSSGRFIKLWRKITTHHAISSEYSLIYLASRLLPALTILERGEGCLEIEYFLDSNPQFFDQNLDFEREFVEVIKYFIARSQREFQSEIQSDLIYRLIIDYCIYENKLEVFEKHQINLDRNLKTVIQSCPNSFNDYFHFLNEVIPWILLDAKRELYHPVRTDINLAEFEPAPQEFEDIESNFWWNHANKVIFLGTSFSLMLLLFVIKLTFAGSFESEDAFIALSGMLFSILLGAGISQRFGMEIRYRLVFKKYHESWRNDFCKRVLEAGRSWEEIEASINSPHDQNIPLNSVRSRYYQFLRRDPAIQLLTTVFMKWKKP